MRDETHAVVLADGYPPVRFPDGRFSVRHEKKLAFAPGVFQDVGIAFLYFGQSHHHGRRLRFGDGMPFGRGLAVGMKR